MFTREVGIEPACRLPASVSPCEKYMESSHIRQLPTTSARTTLFHFSFGILSRLIHQRTSPQNMEHRNHPEGFAADKMHTIAVRFTRSSFKRYKALNCS